MNHEIAYIRQAYKKLTLSNRALTLFNYFLLFYVWVLLPVDGEVKMYIRAG